MFGREKMNESYPMFMEKMGIILENYGSYP
jgi:hypothetical protein